MAQDGLFECMHCLQRSAVWQCDYDFDDFGYAGNGIVHILHCVNCGADIEYRVPIMPYGCAVCTYNNDSLCVLMPEKGYDEGNGQKRREGCPLERGEE